MMPAIAAATGRQSAANFSALLISISGFLPKARYAK
jgi:hypothetical protein